MCSNNVVIPSVSRSTWRGSTQPVIFLIVFTLTRSVVTYNLKAVIVLAWVGRVVFREYKELVDSRAK